MGSLTRRSPHRDEGGFTLVEVLLAVTIMGVVVGALSLALIVAMRSTGAATERLGDSQSAQLLTKWFAGDVQQADAVDGVDTGPGTASGCAGADEGTNVVRFRTTTAPGTSYVSYRVVQVPDEWRLVRRSCVAGQPGDAVVAAHRLQNDAAAQASVTPTQVTITVYVAGGYGYSSTGQRVLVDTPTPCTVGLAVSPSVAQLASDPGPLPGPMAVSATLSGFCPSSTSLTISPAPPGYTGPVPLSGGDGSWSLDLQSLGHSWSSGSYTLGLDGFGTTAQLQLDAPPPPQACQAGLTLSDHALTLASGGKLPKDVTVTAHSVNGACPTSLVVRFLRGPEAVELPLAAASGWTGTVASSVGTWSPGDVPFALYEPSGAWPLDTDVLALSAAAPPSGACTADLRLSHLSLTLTPAGQLPSDVQVRAENVSSGCPSNLNVYYDRGPAGSSVDLQVKRVSGWADTIRRDDGTWNARVVPILLLHGNREVSRAQLELRAAAKSNCKLVDTTPSAGPDNVPVDKKSGKTKQEIRIVMQPTTNDTTPCRGLAARFSTEDGTVLTFLVGTEGQNVTAEIPPGTGPFEAGQVVAVDIIDTWAGDAKVGTSSFKTFDQ